MCALVLFLFHLLICISVQVNCRRNDLENYINPNDLQTINNAIYTPALLISIRPDDIMWTSTSDNYTKGVDCFGFEGITAKFPFIFNTMPESSGEMEVLFYLSNRNQNYTIQMHDNEQFIKNSHFDSTKNIVVIVHGFMCHSNAEWITNMTTAFLDWGDVNVITVDWSKGGTTWKYWKAVANTRTVGTRIATFLSKLLSVTETDIKKVHCVGHSLGAHICSYASYLLGKFRRITGLDPAQPCFKTSDLNMMLDKTDADFVDVIHTNGRNMSKLGLGMSTQIGHQDFYPNGGMKQPGCYNGRWSFLRKFMPITKTKIETMICNHGRSYLLFTESLKHNTCKFIGFKWDHSYLHINESLSTKCNADSCGEMGINADKFPARGSFYVITSEKEPFCDRNRTYESRDFLLKDIKNQM